MTLIISYICQPLFGAGFLNGCWEMWLFSLLFWNVLSLRSYLNLFGFRKIFFSVFGKVFFSLKKCLHSLAKTLPRFSNNQKLTQCLGASLIAVYKSLFKVGQTISNNLLQTNLPAKNNEGFAQVQHILKA